MATPWQVFHRLDECWLFDQRSWTSEVRKKRQLTKGWWHQAGNLIKNNYVKRRVDVYGHLFVLRATLHKRFILRGCNIHHNYLSYHILTVFDSQTCKREDTLLRPSGTCNASITLLFVSPFHMFMMPPQQTCISVNDEQRHNGSRWRQHIWPIWLWILMKLLNLLQTM